MDHKIYVLTAVLLLAICFMAYAETLSLVRVGWDKALLDNLLKEGYDIAYVKPKYNIDLVCTQHELKTLGKYVTEFEIIHQDLVKFYQKRLNSELTMGGYRTYSETITLMDSLYNLYPNIITQRESIATTWDGNYLWVQKISDNPNIDEPEPEIFYDGLIHAREVITHELLLYYMRYLCENYGIDEKVTYLVDNRELWFLPIVNPDGFLYNELTEPGGGGMWRKNRRNNGGGVFGVDLNRNFGYMWGYDDIGSDPDSSEGTYRGPAPFSEPETQGYRNFVNDHQFILNISYHSYGSLYIFPWGYTYANCTHHETYMELGSILAANNSYVFGPAASTIYPGNGVTIDWFYADTLSRDKVFGFICEVGGEDDGFWPEISRIPVLCDETLPGNLKVAELAGIYLSYLYHTIIDSMGNDNGYPDPGESIQIPITLRNRGFEAGSGIHIIALGTSPAITIVSDSSFLGEIPSQSDRSDSPNPLSIQIDGAVENGTKCSIYLAFKDSENYIIYDTISFIIGTPDTIYSDDFNAATTDFTVLEDPDWEWGVPTTGPRNAHSEPNCWATKLNDNYSNTTNSILESPVIFINSIYSVVRLEMYHWYMFEGDNTTLYDGGNFKLKRSTDTDFTIISPESGYDGIIGDHNMFLRDDSAFSRNSQGWEEVAFDLSDYAGDSIIFRFEIGSDYYMAYPGWYVDDLILKGYVPAVIGVEEDQHTEKPQIFEFSLFPNPFNATLNIKLDYTENNQIEIAVYNIYGVKVSTIFRGKPDHRMLMLRWEPEMLATGIYFIRVSLPQRQVTEKILFLK